MNVLRAAPTAAFGGVTIGTLAWADGGFFPESWRWATIGLAATAAIALLLRDRIAPSADEIALLVGVAAFTGWIALSRAWAEDDAQVTLETERAVVYVTGVLAAVVLVERRSVVALLVGIVGAAVALSIYTLARGAGSEDPLEGPIGYANALGAVAAIAILLAVGVAVQVRSRRAAVLALAATAPLVVALVLSGSRGSVVALGVGLVVVAALAPRPLRRWLVVAVGVLALGAVALAAGDANQVATGDRPHYWRVAWAQFTDDPIVGAGAGAFHEYWLVHRPDPSTLNTPEVLDAHSLYLETLAELGIVGLALLVPTLLIPLVAAFRRRDDPITSAAVPAYVAFLLHAGLDWDWEMPAVTLAGLFSGLAILAAAPRPPALGALARGLALGLALVLLAAGVADLV